MYLFRSRLIPWVLLLTFAAAFLYQEKRWISYASHMGDENMHIVSGYLKVRHNDYTMAAYQPPLSAMLEALPLLWLNIKTPFEHESWKINHWHTFGDVLIYDSNPPAVRDQMFVYARWMNVLQTLGLMALVAYWVYQNCGIWGSVLAMGLLAFDPNIIAQSGSARIDMGPVCFTVLALYCFRNLCLQPGRRQAWLAGMTFALAMLTRSYSLVLIPLYLGIAAVLFWRSARFREQLVAWQGSPWRALLRTGGIFIASFTVLLLLVYRFEFRPLFDHVANGPEKIAVVDRLIGDRPELKAHAHHFLYQVPIPARSYWMSWPYVLKVFVSPHYKITPNPKIRVDRPWYAATVNTWRKSTLGFSTLLLVASLLLILNLRAVKDFDLLFLSGAFAFSFVLFILKMNIHGINHAMLLYPLAAMIIPMVYLRCLRVGLRWPKDDGVAHVPTVALQYVIGLFIVFNLFNHMLEPKRVAPNFLAFFNSLSGGPEVAYRYFDERAPEIDFPQYSDLDWGQNFKVIKQATLKYKIATLYVDQEYAESMYRYFEHYGIPYQALSQAQLTTQAPAGWYYIGLRRATSIPALARLKPVEVLGYAAGLYMLERR